MDAELKTLIARAESVLARVEALFPPVEPDPDWKKITAARWRKRGGRGYLQGVAHPHAIALGDLVAIDAQKQAIVSSAKTLQIEAFEADGSDLKPLTGPTPAPAPAPTTPAPTGS